jgi:hypothetical protein
LGIPQNIHPHLLFFLYKCILLFKNKLSLRLKVSATNKNGEFDTHADLQIHPVEVSPKQWSEIARKVCKRGQTSTSPKTNKDVVDSNDNYSDDYYDDDEDYEDETIKEDLNKIITTKNTKVEASTAGSSLDDEILKERK